MTTRLDNQVRLELYREFVRTAEPPSTETIASLLDASPGDVRAAMERLAEGKAIVLQPESREILMANPLCGVPTPFRVRIQDRTYFGSCVWDALGIIAMLKNDAAVDSSCACCGEAMAIRVSGGQPSQTQGIIHFAIPAKQWWQNIVFT